ncbi:MAG: cupredoxin domain-containing protein [Bacillota bacterium]
MRWFSFAGGLLLASVLVLAGCGGRGREEAARPADPVLQAIAEAQSALEELTGAAGEGEPAAARAAYRRFAAAFGQLLGPVSLEDPTAAQRMANAHTRLKQMLESGELDPAEALRQLALLREGLQRAMAVMAGERGQPLPVAGGTGGAEPAPGAAAVTVEVTAGDYRFQPNRIEVKRGTKVTIRLINKGTEPHEFEIEEFDLEIGPIDPGQVRSAAFMAVRSGIFPFECHVDDHLRMGMKGILVVTE